MVRRICMVGVKGIGKTTLNKKILQKMPWIDYIVGSSVLRQLVGEDFNNFDTFPIERKQYFREQAIRFMEQRQLETQKDILVDGHTTLFNPETSLVEGVFTELDCQFFTDLIYYSAQAEIVLNRRQNDQTKKRILDLNTIALELVGERAESIRIAQKYQMGWYEISEEGQKPIHDELFRLLSQLHEN